MAVAYTPWAVSRYTGDASLPQTTATATTAATGNTIVVGVAWENVASITVSDNKGNTFSQLGPTQGGYGSYAQAKTAFFAAYNAAGGSGHTVAVSGTGAAYATVHVLAMTGLDASPADGTIVQIIRTSSPFTVSKTTTNADDVLVCFAGVNGAGTETQSESTGFTKRSEEATGSSYWCSSMWTREVTSTGTYTPSLTSAGAATDMMLHLMAFKVTTGGGGIDGVLSKTLGAATAAGAGTVSNSGAASRTLGAATAASAASVGITGAASKTLGAATVVAADGGGMTGSLSKTLGTATASGSGAVAVGGSATKTLGAAVMAGAASLSITGSASRTLGAATVVASDAAVAPTLGAHTLRWNYLDAGVDPSTSSAITTQASGSSILVVQANHVSNSGVGAPTDSKSNTYTQVTTRKSYTEFPNYGMDLWVCEAATGGASHTVTVQQNGTPTEELDLYVVEIKNAGRLQDHSYVQRAAGTTLVSNSVTTTGPATLVAFWFGDSLSANHTAVPQGGFTVFDSILSIGDLIQSAAASKDVSAAGTYTVTWNETPDQGAILLLFAFESDAAEEITGALAKTLGAATVGAAGGVTIGASLSATLAAASGTASGSVGTGGLASPSLSAVTASGVGAMPITGQASKTLGAAWLSATDGNTGGLSKTLGAIGASGAASIAVTGAAAAVLGGASGSGAGASTISAQGSVALGSVGSAGSATQPIIGTVTATLGGVTVDAMDLVQPKRVAIVSGHKQMVRSNVAPKATRNNLAPKRSDRWH